MTDFFSRPDDFGEIRQSDLQSSLGESLGAEALDTLDPKNSLSGMYIARRMREEAASGGNVGVPGAGGELDVFSGQPLEERQAASDAFRNAVPDTSIADAKARVKQEGLEHHLNLPDQASIKSPVLDLMIQEAHERRDREVAIARGPQGFVPGALGLVTSLGAGMIDPVNMAAFSIPVLGEARMGKLMASAGDSLFARAGVRAIEGGAQGAVGTAVLQPADWWLHTQDGQDYTFADALKSIALGAGMGAGFHAGIGGFGDVRTRMRGEALSGSPQDLLQRGLMTGTHVHADQLADAGVPIGEAPGITPSTVARDIARTAAPGSETSVEINGQRAREVVPPAADREPLGTAEQANANPDFVKWFDGSQATDDSGRPIPVFHGTSLPLGETFEHFDRTKAGSATGAPSAKEAFFFTEDRDLAASYADDANIYEDFAPLRLLNRATFGLYGKANEALVRALRLKSPVREGRVVAAHLAAKNPLIVDYKGTEYREESFYDVIKRAKAAGHDSVLFKNAVDPGFVEGKGEKPANIWAVFEPGQIKIRSFQHRQPTIGEYDQYLRAQLGGLHPAEVLADLPPAAREDAMRSAVADVIADQPARAGGMLEIAADHDPRIADSFEAFHGSPHEFDRFDISKLGSGEGAQSYGHGLYFAENEGVAEGYRSKLADGTIIPNDLLAEYFKPGEIINSYGGRDKVVAFDQATGNVTVRSVDAKGEPTSDLLGLRDRVHHTMPDLKELNAAFRRRGLPEYTPGALYKVRINANQEHFLDWDKPLSEQAEPVRSKLRAAGFEDTQTGKDIYHSLVKYRSDQGGATNSAGMRLSDLDATPEAASGRLRATGIHGIKYLDSGSRDAGEGTRNFVVFDDKHIEITHKNGEAVKLPAPDAAPRLPVSSGPKARGRAAAHPDTLSLNEHLASKGGLRPDPELEAIYGNKRGPFVPGFGPLIRKGGMSLDDALSSAKQHGYMFDPHDAENGTAGVRGREGLGLIHRDLLDHLDNENRGQKLYKPGHEAATKYDPEQEKHVIMGALEQELEKSGADVSAIDPKLLDRTVEIVHREGVSDVLDAYERAIMEDEERYNAIADARRSDPTVADLPGFDDSRAAPGDGGRDRAGDRQAGRPEQGGGRPDDSQPSSHGARAAEAARDPRWRELADVKPAYDDPQTVAESQAADAVTEPASVTPKALSAIEQAAKDAEEAWRQVEPSYTEAERTLVNDALARVDAERKDAEDLIKESAACLAAAQLA